MPFDLQLFQQLNEEYADKPVHPRPRRTDPEGVAGHGESLAEFVNDMFGVRGKRCLEIGCGRGAVARALVERYGCEVVGVDVTRYETWDSPQPAGVELLQLDITSQSYQHLGKFDFIYSNSVWEHIRHPRAALAAAKQLLARGGDFYLSANLYRGPLASHRTREVFFPWPHLLFSDEVFEQFYALRGEAKRPAWVNKLTATHYLEYVEEYGFSPVVTWFSKTKFDEAFYRRFEEILCRYPKQDLEMDFVKMHLRHASLFERVAHQTSWIKVQHLPSHASRAVRMLRRAVRKRSLAVGGSDRFQIKK